MSDLTRIQVQQTRDVFKDVGTRVPRLLAAYLCGDAWCGRALWNSPLEVSLIVDVASTSNRFGDRYLAPDDFAAIRDTLNDRNARYSFRMYSLCEIDDGAIDLLQERFQPTLFYYEGARAVARGVRVYHAPDFLLEKFEADIKARWCSEGEFRQKSRAGLAGRFRAVGLPEISDAPIRTRSGLDIIWIAEVLQAFESLCASARGFCDMPVERLIDDEHSRAKVSANWRRFAEYLSAASRHVVGCASMRQPATYLQLIEGMAGLGIVDYDDVWYLSRYLEHVGVISPHARSGWSAAEIEALCLYQECCGYMGRFSDGLARFVHYTLLQRSVS